MNGAGGRIRQQGGWKTQLGERRPQTRQCVFLPPISHSPAAHHRPLVEVVEGSSSHHTQTDECVLWTPTLPLLSSHVDLKRSFRRI